MKRLLKIHTLINRLSAFEVNARIGQGSKNPLPVRAFLLLKCDLTTNFMTYS